MRPPREDIAAPPFPPGLVWVGGPEPRLDRLLATGPLLVWFFDFAQLNSLRVLDYVRCWHERYASQGLGLLGVHTPRLEMTRPAEALEAALPRLGIVWPVAVDAEQRTFRDYGCHGWPSLFLWGRGGALRWYHLGEGEYAQTEAAIVAELGAPPDAGWPEPLAPLRPGDAPGATVIAPTPELLPGQGAEPWRPEEEAGGLEVGYEAASAHAAAAGAGTIEVTLDGGEQHTIEVAGPGLYELAGGERHGRHQLRLRASPGIEIHSIQFAPGPA